MQDPCICLLGHADELDHSIDMRFNFHELGHWIDRLIGTFGSFLVIKATDLSDPLNDEHVVSLWDLILAALTRLHLEVTLFLSDLV